MYYMVDWWGNTRGEDVRRFPVRSFGIRPAWDAGDAYDPGRNTDATPYERLYNSGSPLVNLKGIVGSGSSNISLSTGVTIPRFGGRQNTSNNNNANTLVDLFMPATAMRVGDMGNGRGVRYPTQFNEDRLTALNEADYTMDCSNPKRWLAAVLKPSLARPSIPTQCPVLPHALGLTRRTSKGWTTTSSRSTLRRTVCTLTVALGSVWYSLVG